MLLFREYWAKLFPDLPDVYIFVDGSPQWKGVELYAASFDIFMYRDGQWTRQRRLLPVIRIGMHMLSREGKALVLLWQSFLLVGPDFHALRRFLFIY